MADIINSDSNDLIRIVALEKSLSSPRFIDQWRIAEFLTSFGSERTRKTYKIQLLKFFKFCQSKKIYFPREVGVFHVNVFREQMVILGLSESTINNSMSVLSSYFSFLVEQRVAEKNPILKSHLKKSGKRKVDTLAISSNDLSEIRLKMMKKPLFEQLCVELFIATGLRFSEILNIKTSDIKKHGDIFFIDVLTKGGKPRKVILTDKLKDLIGLWLGHIGDVEYLLTNPSHISESKLRRILNKAFLSCKRKYTPHSFRVNFITSLADNGVPVDVIADLVAHADITMTSKYIKREGQLSAEKLELLNRIF